MLAVWNPFLRRVKWINSNPNSKFDRFGFGYDSVSRDNYKILRIRGWLDIKGKLEIDIYEFRSKLWRSVDASLDPCAELWYAPSNALSMDGNMYWIAYRKKDNSKTIASFDFSRETFKDIGCCVPFDEAVLSGFERDRLSLLHYQSGVKIEVWVTNKVTDVVVSWSKYFNVTRPDLPRFVSSPCEFPTYFIDHKTNSIMVWYGHLLLDEYIKCILYTVYKMCDGEIIREQVVPGRRTGPALWAAIRNKCFGPTFF
ncbi:unnamed protein product [Microthlaspi erraticum]|uniref:F-box associated beta-propeller type 1 domain-containing protein n=1 Tax=Microthlaspi erraticum TaxID=1685480 RepID=A0A6D2KN39_9BRAS|nr:unnamed protein product [Microthlaspi erraticum]